MSDRLDDRRIRLAAFEWLRRQVEDGPMLLHGLKGLHKTRLIVPRSARNRPGPARLEIRYERFLSRG